MGAVTHLSEVDISKISEAKENLTSDQDLDDGDGGDEDVTFIVTLTTGDVYKITASGYHDDQYERFVEFVDDEGEIIGAFFYDKVISIVLHDSDFVKNLCHE